MYKERDRDMKNTDKNLVWNGVTNKYIKRGKEREKTSHINIDKNASEGNEI